MSSNHIIFYSKQCRYSNEFLIELYKNIELFKKFIKVDVNDKSITLPAYIKSVPTILVPGNYGKNSILVGNDVFKWLDMMKNINNNPQQQQPQQQQPQQQQQQNGISDYDPFGMSGFSDGFSYLSDNAAPMDKSFEFLDGNVVNSNLGMTIPDDDSINSDKLKSESYERAMKDLEASRNNDVPQGVARQ